MEWDGGEKWEEGWGGVGGFSHKEEGTAGQGGGVEEDGIRGGRQEWMLLGETLYSFPKSYLPMGKALTAKGSSQFQPEKRRLLETLSGLRCQGCRVRLEGQAQGWVSRVFLAPGHHHPGSCMLFS